MDVDVRVNVQLGSQIMSRDSKVEGQPSTSAVVNKRSSSQDNFKVSFWKWVPLGRDSNRQVMDFIPRLMKRSRDPVNVGGFKGRTTADADGPSEPSSSYSR